MTSRDEWAKLRRFSVKQESSAGRLFVQQLKKTKSTLKNILSVFFQTFPSCYCDFRGSQVLNKSEEYQIVSLFVGRSGP